MIQVNQMMMMCSFAYNVIFHERLRRIHLFYLLFRINIGYNEFFLLLLDSDSHPIAILLLQCMLQRCTDGWQSNPCRTKRWRSFLGGILFSLKGSLVFRLNVLYCTALVGGWSCVACNIAGADQIPLRRYVGTVIMIHVHTYLHIVSARHLDAR